MSVSDRDLGMHRPITRRKNGGQPPHLRARQPFGRITIANTASGADDSTELAIDMAARAVGELAPV